MKKIYSLNLISYLRTKGFKEINIDRDGESGNIFFVFEESSEITNSIKEYKKPEITINLHDFVANFKNIKKEISAFNKQEVKL